MGNADSILEQLEMDREKGEVYEDWTMTPGKLDGVFVTVFSAAHPPVSRKRPYIERALQASRVLRHPGLLKYIDGGIMGGEVVVVTEHATPLQYYDLNKLSPLHVSAGLLSVLQTLVFMHDRAGVSHNNLSGASIFVTTTGSWKLWGLEYSCSFGDLNRDHIEHINSYCHESSIPPDDKSRISPTYQHARDSYAFACFVEQILSNGNVKELPGASEFLSLVKRSGLNSEWSSRPRLSLLVDHHFFSHDFLKINENLTNILLLPEDTRDQFIKSLADCLRKYPEDLVSSTMAANLLSRPLLLQPATVTHLIPAVLTPKSGNAEANNLHGLFSPVVFERDIVPPLVELYSVHDATVRQVLLSHLPSYVNLIPKDRLKLEVLPELLLGIRDCNDTLVSSTLHALAQLVLILGANTVIGTNRQNLFTTNKPKGLPLSHSKNRLSNSEVRHTVRSICLEDLGETQNGPPVLPLRTVSLNIDNNISPEVLTFEKDKLESVSYPQIPERSSPDGGEDRSNIGYLNIQDIQTIDDEGSGQWSDWEDSQGDTQFPKNFSAALMTLNQLKTHTDAIEKNTETLPYQDLPSQRDCANNVESDEDEYNESDKKHSYDSSAMKLSGIKYKNILVKKNQISKTHNTPQELGKEYDIMAIKINKKRDEELDLFADLVPSFSTKKFDLESMLIEADKSQNPLSLSVSATLARMDLDTNDVVGAAWGDEEDYFSHNSVLLESSKEKVKSPSIDNENYFSSEYESWTNLEGSKSSKKEINSIASPETNAETDMNTIVNDRLLINVSDSKVEDNWDEGWGKDF